MNKREYLLNLKSLSEQKASAPPITRPVVTPSPVTTPQAPFRGQPNAPQPGVVGSQTPTTPAPTGILDAIKNLLFGPPDAGVKPGTFAGIPDEAKINPEDATKTAVPPEIEQPKPQPKTQTPLNDEKPTEPSTMPVMTPTVPGAGTENIGVINPKLGLGATPEESPATAPQPNPQPQKPGQTPGVATATDEKNKNEKTRKQEEEQKSTETTPEDLSNVRSNFDALSAIQYGYERTKFQNPTAPVFMREPATMKGTPIKNETRLRQAVGESVESNKLEELIYNNVKNKLNEMQGNIEPSISGSRSANTARMQEKSLSTMSTKDTRANRAKAIQRMKNSVAALSEKPKVSVEPKMLNFDRKQRERFFKKKS